MAASPLNSDELVYYRDCFRKARYAALANSEGFQEICYAVEELAVRLAGKRVTMRMGEAFLAAIAAQAPSDLHERLPGLFSPFNDLFEIVRQARNDAMHTGAYARRATARALELCLLLEAGLMSIGDGRMRKVRDYMVREPVTVEGWTPLAKVRQLMLLHSFSNIPVCVDGGSWYLVNELAVARFLRGSRPERDRRLGLSVIDAFSAGLERRKAVEVALGEDVDAVLDPEHEGGGASSLWLVVDQQRRLLGVLTPFEVM